MFNFNLVFISYAKGLTKLKGSFNNFIFAKISVCKSVHLFRFLTCESFLCANLNFFIYLFIYYLGLVVCLLNYLLSYFFIVIIFMCPKSPSAFQCLKSLQHFTETSSFLKLQIFFIATDFSIRRKARLFLFSCKS